MKTVFSDVHRRHHGRGELYAGGLVSCFETPERVEIVLARIREVGLGSVLSPRPFGLRPIERIHSGDYLRFLENAWAEWRQVHGDRDAIPSTWPVRAFAQEPPSAIEGKLGFYAMDASTPITSGTWEAATAAVDCSLTALDEILRGERGAFALGRPPGHHADRDHYGGYCYLNQAAITAQAFLDGHVGRRACILDVDYHHGNGTQSIFYRRSDVLYVSLHADPRQEYPYFLGHASERGAGPGEGFNRNLPLAFDSPPEIWFDALEVASDEIEGFAPDVLFVSLGVDTFVDDPISRLRLESEDYRRVGERIARIGTPTLFVLEGGYAVESIGVNVVNTLTGYDG